MPVDTRIAYIRRPVLRWATVGYCSRLPQTASPIVTSASSRRPTERVRLVDERHGEVGQERVGTRLRELPADADRFFDRLERLLTAPQIAQSHRLGVLRGRLDLLALTGPNHLHQLAAKNLDRTRRRDINSDITITPQLPTSTSSLNHINPARATWLNAGCV